MNLKRQTFDLEKNMKHESLSLKEAQSLILSSQKLTGPDLKPLQIIKHLGHVQIDTISVVERAHHHVFWTRNHKYQASDLTDLVKSRKVFEYWSHAASYLPMNDYRFSLPIKKHFREKESSWLPRDLKLMNEVEKRIRTEGPLRSKDFENSKKGQTGWWDGKPAKKALERLFLEGRLEISRREGFQKVYDIPERVIPSKIDSSMPSREDYIKFLIKRSLIHHGLASVNEIAYLGKKSLKIKILNMIMDMLENNELVQVSVENKIEKYFSFSKSLRSIERPKSKVLILSPFDNLVIQRKKLKSFFNFDYRIECYVPAQKRQYGYFCLPVFVGSQAVARIDCRADRKEKTLIINSIHCEKGVDIDSFQKKLKPELKAFAKFNGCESVLKSPQ